MVFFYKISSYIRNFIYIVAIFVTIMMFVSMGVGGGIFSLVLFGVICFGVYKLDKKFTTPSVELYKREKIKAMARKDVMDIGKGSALGNLNKIVADVNKRKPKKPKGETIF